jgi:hypothetical protein
MTQQQPVTPRARGDAEAPHLSPVTPAEDARTILINQISWGAVFAGVVIALTAQLLLNLLGVGIGLATIDPSAANNPDPKTFSISAGVWWAVSGIVAALIGGYAAGRLSGRPKESTTGWHGLIAWAGTTLVVFYLLSTALGAVVGGAFSAVSSAMGGVGQIASTAAQTAAPAIASGSNPFADLEQRIRSAAGGTDPAATRDAAVGAVRALVTGDASQAQATRERAAAAVAQAQNIPIEQAREQVVQYEQQYRQAMEQAKQKATAAADAAAKTASRAALFSVLALALGGLAAWFGGRAGAVDPTLTSRALGRQRGR